MTDAVEPADFYTGLVAELYGPLRSETFDPSHYAKFIERSGEPALELGCGDGDPMLALRAQGLDVEGLDSSTDMLDLFRAKAAALDLDVTLHHATFQSMNLGKHYRSIYLAGATFNLLPDDEAAQAALVKISEHLHPEGSALIPLFTPQAPAESDIGKMTEQIGDDGATLRVTVVDITRDETTRDQRTELRYERILGDVHEVADRSWLLHWFDVDHFTDMAAEAGLTTLSVRGADGKPATTHDTAYTFILGHNQG